MKTKPNVKKNSRTIRRTALGEGVCLCGNRPIDYGFFPCNAAGEIVEPTLEAWTTDCYVCDKCGRIINQETLEVVGRRAKHTVTNHEQAQG